ncbi:MAG: class I SAM-dependent methyltransferase [Planctomycetaceae bacterium]
MAEHALFDGYVENYEDACGQGLRLTGERRDYFARRRSELTAARHENPAAVRRVIDFGCGLGHTTLHLLSAFPNAHLTGFDPAPAVIAEAQRRYAGPRADFRCDTLDDCQDAADLVYCNGVFHHIEVGERLAHARRIAGWLKTGGTFALWENNPWNPGTRFVMKRIPFDHDAVTLSYLQSRRLLRAAGLQVRATRFHFYFPSLLKALRPFERLMERVPLGGQYCVFARRTAGPPSDGELMKAKPSEPHRRER